MRARLRQPPIFLFPAQKERPGSPKEKGRETAAKLNKTEDDTMIRIQNLSLPIGFTPEQLRKRAARALGVHPGQLGEVTLVRQSIDARRKNDLHCVCAVHVSTDGEEALVRRAQNPNASLFVPVPYAFPPVRRRSSLPPVVTGMGPSGLFAALYLARSGIPSIILERGRPVEERTGHVEHFWATGELNIASNVQFGEGGAGAYSDGKLTTRIGDALCETVLETLAAHGAPADIVKKAKPHVGTDILKDVVREMRREIVKNGGEVHFRTALTGVSLKNGALTAVRADGMDIPCERAVIAVGHSARDTFLALHENGVYFEPKAFSVGVRIEHLQSELDRALYGKFAGHPLLPPAEYNLSRRADGRACYSFCMCPGGVVVAAQSEQNTVVTNGMSYHARSGKNANAALAVSVDPEDFENGTPFGGVALQRQIEHAAYAQTGSYRAPCQRVGDFLADRPTKSLGAVEPTYPVGVEPGRAAASLPDFAQTMLRDSLPYFGRKIRGYDAADALLTGPETRTSSPVRMKRGEDLFGLGVAGLIPCGEGAGYAGGIMSAAVDGILTAEAILNA